MSVPTFQLLATGQFASNVGDYCYAVALPWLVLSGNGSATQLGIILACYGIPRAALTTSGGILADRFGPRAVMLASDLVRCALVVLLAVFAANGVTSLAALALVAAVLGVFSALFMPASYTMMPSLIDSGQLVSANAVYQALQQTAGIIGPVIGGVIVAEAGTTVAFSVDAASYLVSAVSLALIGVVAARTAAAGRGTAPESEAATEELSEAPAQATQPSGWQLLLRARVLQVIFLVSIVANFAVTGTTEVALPALAHARFGADGYGAILTCLAIGSLAGTTVVVKVRRRGRPAVLLGGAFLMAALAIGLLPFLGGLPGAAGAIFVFGVAIGFDGVLAVTLLQQWAPEGMLGRVMGMILFASTGSFPISTLVAGLLARHLGPSAVFPIAGVLLAAAILGGLTQREFRDFGSEAVPPGTENGALTAAPESTV